MFKKILGLIVALAMILSLFAAPSMAATTRASDTGSKPLIVGDAVVKGNAPSAFAGNVAARTVARTAVGEIVCSDGDPQHKNLNFTLLSDGPWDRFEVGVRNRAFYHTCFKKLAPHKWQVRIRLRTVSGAYDIRDPDTDKDNPCKLWPAHLEYVSFNYYFWDKKGRNYNPSTKRLSCQDDGWNEFSLNLKEAADLIVTSDGSPMWRDNSKMVIDNQSDDSGSAHGKLTPVL